MELRASTKKRRLNDMNQGYQEKNVQEIEETQKEKVAWLERELLKVKENWSLDVAGYETKIKELEKQRFWELCAEHQKNGKATECSLTEDGKACPLYTAAGTYREEVFQIPDIVDAIFGHLDSKSALACRRVCKTWKSISDHIFHYDFFLAANRGRLRAVKSCIARGVNVNMKLRGRCGETALHLAAFSSRPQNLEVGRFLIESGADVNSINTRKETPLHHAVQGKGEKGKEFVNMLIDAKADVNAGSNSGGTPLIGTFYAKTPHTMDYVRTLHQAGADVKCQNARGNTALHHMVVRVIGRSIGRNDKEWHWATYQTGESLEQDIELVERMITAGADKNHKNKEYHDPLEHAAEYFYECNGKTYNKTDLMKLESVQRLLKSFGVKRLKYFDFEDELEFDDMW